MRVTDVGAVDPGEAGAQGRDGSRIPLVLGTDTSVERWRAGDSLVVAAVSDQGRRKILREATALREMGDRGVPVPHLQAFDPTGAWMRTPWVQAGEPTGEVYVRRALEVADLIAQGPPPHLPVPARQWSAGRSGRVRRTLRLIVGGVPLHRFLRARAEAEALSERSTCHGDFYFRNVLAGPGDDVSVIDWEYCGTAAAFTDHVRFWSALKSASDRDRALAMILQGRTEAQVLHIATLARWLGLRLLAENVSAPRRRRTPADLAHARIAAREGEALYRRIRRGGKENR